MYNLHNNHNQKVYLRRKHLNVPNCWFILYLPHLILLRGHSNPSVIFQDFFPLFFSNPIKHPSAAYFEEYPHNLVNGADLRSAGRQFRILLSPTFLHC